MPPFCELLCQPRRADLLCTTSTPRVLPGGAFAHLILMTASANIFYNRGAIVLAIYLLDMKAPAYKCKTMPPNRNFDLDHDAGNTLDTKITEPRVQTRLCLAERGQSQLKNNKERKNKLFDAFLRFVSRFARRVWHGEAAVNAVKSSLKT